MFHQRREMLIVGLGVFVQLILGRWLPSPWLVPDLTLVGVLLVMARMPQHSLGPALMAGLLVMAVTVQQSLVVGLAYVGAGGLMRLLSSWWDLADPFLQPMALALAEAFLLVIWFLLGVPITLGLLLLGGLRLLVTVASLLLVRLLIPSSSAPSPIHSS